MKITIDVPTDLQAFVAGESAKRGDGNAEAFLSRFLETALRRELRERAEKWGGPDIGEDEGGNLRLDHGDESAPQRRRW